MRMDEFRKLTTQEKALRINLSKAIYGSFAEIGAGQEVAANFFKVGGASGTETFIGWPLVPTGVAAGKSPAKRGLGA